jgi:hypothetical protein
MRDCLAEKDHRPVRASLAWRGRLEALLYEVLGDVTGAGKHGEGAVRVVVQDGVIQYAEKVVRLRRQ